MKLLYEYIVIFFNFKPHQISFIHYKSRIAVAFSRLVVDEDDNRKFRIERVNMFNPVKHDYEMFTC